MSFPKNFLKNVKTFIHDAGQDIGKAAKDVGNVAKDVGQDVGRTAKTVGQDVGKAAKDVGQEVGKIGKAVGNAAEDVALQVLIPLRGGMKVAIQKAKYPDPNPPTTMRPLFDEFVKKVLKNEQFETLEHLAVKRRAAFHISPVNRAAGMTKTAAATKAPASKAAATQRVAGGGGAIASKFGAAEAAAAVKGYSAIPGAPILDPNNPAAYAQALAAQALQNSGGGSGGGGGGGDDGSGDSSGDNSQDTYYPDDGDDSGMDNIFAAMQPGYVPPDYSDDTNGDDTGFGDSEAGAGDDDFSSDSYGMDQLEKEVKYEFGPNINDGYAELSNLDLEYLQGAGDEERNAYRRYKYLTNTINTLETLESVDSTVATAAGIGAAAGTVVPGLGNAVGAGIGTLVGLIVEWFKNAKAKHDAGQSTPQQAAATAAAAAGVAATSDAQKNMALGESPFANWYTDSTTGGWNGMHVFESILGMIAIIIIIVGITES